MHAVSVRHATHAFIASCSLFIPGNAIPPSGPRSSFFTISFPLPLSSESLSVQFGLITSKGHHCELLYSRHQKPVRIIVARTTVSGTNFLSNDRIMNLITSPFLCNVASSIPSLKLLNCMQHNSLRSLSSLQKKCDFKSHRTHPHSHIPKLQNTKESSV